jgi:acyl-CoA thioesterase-1
MTCRPAVAALALLAAAGLVLPRTVVARGQSAVNAEPDRPVILAVGESTTAGYGVDREESYPAQLQSKLDELGYHYRVVNHGVSGSTVEGALTRMDRGIALKPKIVIIALGGNDAGGRVPAAVTRANLAKLISMFARVGAQVFVTDRTGARDGSQPPSMFAELAREHHAVLMPPLLTGVAGNPDLLISDGSHPNGAGYTIIVRNILAVLKPYL